MTDPAAVSAPSSAVHRGMARLRETSALHGVLLGLFALVTALVLALVNDLTDRPIAERATEDLYASLAQVIAPDLHDNDLTAAPVTLEDGVEGPLLVYRATADGAVTGVAFRLVAMGYAGRIDVLLGVDPTGKLLGVRVLAHAETPGLGDKIEVPKSDWILGFAGMSLRKPGPEGWKVRKDGGTIDQFSGATITPRAVVEAVHRGLQVFARHQTALLDPDFVQESRP